MLCELAVLVNEHIWDIFAPSRGRLCKKLLKTFEGQGLIALRAKFQLADSLLHVFCP